jgi:hypothetical protein
MTNVRVKTKRMARVSQGDIFRDVECIESVSEKAGIIEVSKIVFPLVVVLTQECDLEQDARNREARTNQDKVLFAVLVSPLYNADQVFLGKHLTELGMEMSPINAKKSPGEMLMKNERPRYHYIDFPDEVPIVASIVDFKHYFSISGSYLERIRRKNFVCRLSELFREDLSQRFAAYLARIGLPELGDKGLVASAASIPVTPHPLATPASQSTEPRQ